MALHDAIGNQAIQRLLNAGVIRAQLKVGASGDVHEQEADRLAEHVVRMDEPELPRQPEEGDKEGNLAQPPLASHVRPLVQSHPEEKEKEGDEVVHAKADSSARGPVALADRLANRALARLVHQPHDGGCRHQEQEANAAAETLTQTADSGSESVSLHSLPGPSARGGVPLPNPLLESLGGALGVDLRPVRVHDDRESDQLTAFFGARALSAGTDIYFGRHRYRPYASSGRRLLAHEVAHVIQQAGGVNSQGPRPALRAVHQRAIQLQPFSLEEIDRLIAENERQGRQPGLSPEQLDAFSATRNRLVRLREQIASGAMVDWSLAVTGPTGTHPSDVSPGPTEGQLLDFYCRVAAFSSGLEVLGTIVDRVRERVETENESWFIFSDREFTRPVVDDILRSGTRFADRVLAFLEGHVAFDDALARQVASDLHDFTGKLRALQAVAPEHVGAWEARGRRFVGGVTGAAGSFLGFLRLGLIDSWGQFIFEGSEERVRQAQDGFGQLLDSLGSQGPGEMVSRWGADWAERLEESERLERYTSSGSQFGGTAFDVYFAGRGLVSAGRGVTQLSRAAGAFRAMGRAHPWWSALRAGASEAVAFRGVGLHGGGGFWGSQFGLAGMGATVEVTRVIDVEVDLTAKHWRAVGESMLMPEARQPPGMLPVARQTVSSSAGSPFQPTFAAGDVPTYALSYQPSVYAVSRGGTVVRVRVPVRGLVDKNLLLAEQAGVASAEVSAVQRNIFGLRAPEHLRPSTMTPEAYALAAESPQVQAWVRANLGIRGPAANVLEGMQPLEWEQLALAPSLRPYVVEAGPNPLAGQGASPPLAIRPGRLPSYHPALNPNVASELMRSFPGGARAFEGYTNWLRAGAGAELGFTPAEIGGFERLGVLGGAPGPTASWVFAPTELPFMGIPPSVVQTPEIAPSQTQMHGYANWIRAATGSRSSLLQTGGPPQTRSVSPRPRGPAEAVRQIATIAARIRLLGGTVTQLRAGPITIFLSASVPADPDVLRQIARYSASVWTGSDANLSAGIVLFLQEGSAVSVESLDPRSVFSGIRLPRGLRLDVRRGSPGGQ